MFQGLKRTPKLPLAEKIPLCQGLHLSRYICTVKNEGPVLNTVPAEPGFIILGENTVDPDQLVEAIWSGSALISTLMKIHVYNWSAVG